MPSVNLCWQILGLSIVFVNLTTNIEIKTATLKEDSPINTSLDIQMFNDKPFDNIKIIGDGFNHYFRFDKDRNRIVLIREIDLENSELCFYNQYCCDNNGDCKFEFLLRVLEKQTLVLTWKLNIFVEDINDWSPTFAQKQYIVQFHEGVKSIGQRQILPTATDLDFSKKNRMITYSLQSSTVEKNVFQLLQDSNSHTPMLLLLNALDCETKHHYLLDLLATDGAGKEGRVLIYVKVIDINEYSPAFFQDLSTSFSIFESMMKRAIITQIQATDNDAYPNNNVTYKLESMNDVTVTNTFSIDTYSGELQLIGDLDYERIKSYSIIVIAFDSAPKLEQKSSSLSISISILDVNDNYPELKFETENQKAIIKENQPTGTSVTILKINDRDTNQNGEVTCQLGKNDNLFFLNRILDKFYQIESNKVFDREEIDKYFVIIICHDHGTPSLTTSLTLTILIDDENDQAPQFVKGNLRFIVKENSPIQTVIRNSNNEMSKIDVIDQDIVGNLSFFIDYAHVQNNASYSVNIETYSGILYVASLIDREVISEIRVKICCNDTVHFTCNDVYIDVEDENDNSPFLLNDLFRLTIEENTIHYEKALLTFHIQDYDSTNTGFRLTFDKSTTEDVLKYFKLDHDKLYLKKSVDREDITSFQFLIQISDKHPQGDLQLFTTAKVYVKISDQNDNLPKFIFPNDTHFSINVSCHEPVGHLLGKIFAFDPDYGDNGTILYELVKIFPHKELSLFHIDRHTGEIFINSASLNEQFCRYNFILMISARDLGDQQNNNLNYRKYISKAFGKLQVTLLDIPRSYSARITLMTPRLILTVILSFSTLFLMCLLISWALIIFRQRKRNYRVPDDETKCYYSMNLLNNNILDQKPNDEDECQSQTVTYIHREDIENFDSFSECKTFRPVTICPTFHSNKNAMILLDSKIPLTPKISHERPSGIGHQLISKLKCKTSSTSTSTKPGDSLKSLSKKELVDNKLAEYEPLYVLRTRTVCIPKHDSKNSDLYTTLLPHSSIVKFTPSFSDRNGLENESDTYV